MMWAIKDIFLIRFGFSSSSSFGLFFFRLLISILCLAQASGVRVHDITVNVPADMKFRRLNVSFYDPSDYRPPAPFLFKPALALILDTSSDSATSQPAESGVGRLLKAFTESFWKELSAGG